VAQLCVAALDKGWAIAGEPRLDLSHACSPECINIYGLVSNNKVNGYFLSTATTLSKSVHKALNILIDKNTRSSVVSNILCYQWWIEVLRWD
jgi:hypothetical protein